ncbi:MAG: ABC transporter ATP-binding protein [Acidimicrobiaceae bacterium]|nr:ABC transporter ATP-binding protein [Acidimicrobiaceae bacterium]
MSVAVQVVDVSKRFRLYKEKMTSLKERVIHLGKVPYEEFWALRDINIEVQEGETLGLIGHNGSGKSTLLKCIAGILLPSSGEIRVRGRVAAMLELGAGFHPELSGRDNIYLNASLLGMPKREVDRRFDDIVDFSELGGFIENQVKFYSSGMYTRLGFAVAVNMDPDVLLIDEVLAVGDENFQRKCLDKVNSFQKEGRTIVFVSHSADLVRAVCDRAYVLDHSKVVGGGPTAEAIGILRDYQLKGSGLNHDPNAVEAIDQSDDSTVGSSQRPQSPPALITSISLLLPDPSRGYAVPNDIVSLDLHYESTSLQEVLVGVEVTDVRGELVFSATSEDLGFGSYSLYGQGEFIVELGPMPLLDGVFSVAASLYQIPGGARIDWRPIEQAFKIVNPTKCTGMVNMPVSILQESGS